MGSGGSAATSLNRDRIVAAAVELADQAGLTSVSIRKVADRLGSGVMSLYRHIEGKDELLALMVDLVTDRYSWQVDHGADWREQLHAFFRQDWNLYQEHPWILQATAVMAPPVGPATLRSMEMAMACLQPLGMSLRESARAVTTLNNYVQGSARLALSVAEERPSIDDRTHHPPPDEPGPAWQVRLATEDLAAFPLVKALVELPVQPRGPAWYSHGLDIILDGIESRRTTDHG